MRSTDSQDLLELDVQEFEVLDAPAQAPSQSIPPRTLTACEVC